MTCIAGLVHEGRVYIGGDSAISAGYDQWIGKEPKVFRKGPFLIGTAGSVRAKQLVRYGLNVAPRHPDMNVTEYMVTTFINAIRECWKAGGHAKVDNGQEVGDHGYLLVGYEGRLFSIYTDYQVTETLDGYDAIGSGAPNAQGALFATKDKPPEERIRIALEAAERHSAGVRGPFVIESM